MRNGRWIICVLLVLAVVLGAIKYSRYYFIPRKFFTVESGLHRGGLQSEHQFYNLSEEYKFNLVISLTGEVPAERKMTEERGARFVVFTWSGSGIGPFEEYQQVGKLLHDPAQRPGFYHCAAGEKRTNAATFAYSLERGLTPEEAFAVIERYGFSKTKNTKLYQHLQDYVAWRARQARPEK